MILAGLSGVLISCRSFVARVFLLIAFYFALTLVLIALRGGEWDCLITVNNPKKRMVAAFTGFAIWNSLRPRRDCAPLAGVLRGAGQTGLLLAGVTVAFAAGETMLRSFLIVIHLKGWRWSVTGAGWSL